MKRLLPILLALATCAGCVTDSFDGQTFSHTRFVTDEKVGGVEIHFADGTWAKLGAIDSQVDPVAVAMVQSFAAVLTTLAKLAVAIP